jgi:hypothetical protein
MRKNGKFLFLFVMFIGICITACTDKNLDSTTPTRSYEQDATLLSYFVDIDLENGEYFLNTEKSSLLNFLPDSYKNDLIFVSDANRERFLQEMDVLNSNLANIIEHETSDYIVFSIPGREAVIKQLNPVSTIRFVNNQEIASRATNQSYYLSLSGYNGTKNYLDFKAGKYVDCDVELTAMRGQSYFVTIRETKSNAKPDWGDSGNPHAITYSGYGYYRGTTSWTHYDRSSNLSWSMEAYITIPPMNGHADFLPV